MDTVNMQQLFCIIILTLNQKKNESIIWLQEQSSFSKILQLMLHISHKQKVYVLKSIKFVFS